MQLLSTHDESCTVFANEICGSDHVHLRADTIRVPALFRSRNSPLSAAWFFAGTIPLAGQEPAPKRPKRFCCSKPSDGPPFGFLHGDTRRQPADAARTVASFSISRFRPSSEHLTPPALWQIPAGDLSEHDIDTSCDYFITERASCLLIELRYSVGKSSPLVDSIGKNA